MADVKSEVRASDPPIPPAAPPPARFLMMAFWALLGAAAGIKFTQSVWQILGRAAGEVSVAVPVGAVVAAIRSDPGRWVDFMMKFEPGVTEPDPRRARNSALTIALAYIAEGVPLAPYFVLQSVHAILIGSVIVTLIALTGFGFVKGRFTTNRPWRSAGQTVLVGGLAAAAAFAIAEFIG